MLILMAYLATMLWIMANGARVRHHGKVTWKPRNPHAHKRRMTLKVTSKAS
jgi:hypothetical protein